mgnify:CR=1 FL=1
MAVITVDDTGDYHKFISGGNLTYTEMKTFFQKFKGNELTRHLKTEDPFAENNVGPLYKWIGSLFHQRVKESKEDILVLFFASWDIHYKEILKYFPILADKLRIMNPNVKLVTVDATLNDVTGVPIESYPVIYFIRADKKSSPIRYMLKLKGEKAIAKFIKKNTSFPWKDIATEERLADRDEVDDDEDEVARDEL